MATAQQRRAAGEYGEGRAAGLLTAAGMVLLDRNWRCELGELDLVLRDGEALVFCEVKTRTDASYGSALEAVGPRKLARLRRLAARWMAEHHVHADHVRLDLVGVHLGPGRPRLEHVRGVG